MKHKYAEMIKAKVDNMDLVVFCEGNGKWYECECEFGQIAWWEDFRYFLCLPQRKEACLHWLNGGDVQVSGDGVKWESYDLSPEHPKYPMTDFTGFEFQFRIKPKKEKRVIGVNKDGRTTSHYAIDDEGCYAVDEIRITGKGNPDEWQFIEIEVEV